MKKNKIIYIIIIAVILIATITGITCIGIKYSTGVELTQLSPQGSRQMMGYFLKTKEDTVIVIDGGTEKDSNNLKKYIDNNNGIVDYWIMTHTHDDHIGAMVSLLEQDAVKVENIICSLNEIEWYRTYDSSRVDIVERLFNVLKDINIKDAKINEQIDIDNINIEIFGIKNPEITENSGNNQSMVFKIHVNNKSILFLGDTGEESGKKLIETNGNNLQSYAVQMAHHGQAGVTEEVYKLVNPRICFWSTPEWLWDNNLNGQGYNTGSWKTLETRAWIKKLKVNKNYVAKDGDITIKIW